MPLFVYLVFIGLVGAASCFSVDVEVVSGHEKKIVFSSERTLEETYLKYARMYRPPFNKGFPAYLMLRSLSLLPLLAIFNLWFFRLVPMAKTGLVDQYRVLPEDWSRKIVSEGFKEFRLMLEMGALMLVIGEVVKSFWDYMSMSLLISRNTAGLIIVPFLAFCTLSFVVLMVGCAQLAIYSSSSWNWIRHSSIVTYLLLLYFGYNVLHMSSGQLLREERLSGLGYYPALLCVVMVMFAVAVIMLRRRYQRKQM